MIDLLEAMKIHPAFNTIREDLVGNSFDLNNAVNKAIDCLKQSSIPDKWKTEIIEIRKYYAKCPYCDFSFEMTPNRQLPCFCGACGRRLRRGEE